MTEIVFRDAEVLRVKPNEFLIIHVRWDVEEDGDFLDRFVKELEHAGLKRGRFVVVNSPDLELSVVVEKVP